MKNLRGQNNPTYAMRLNGDTFLITSGANSTVFGDGQANTLKGHADTDWFFRFPSPTVHFASWPQVFG